MKIVAFGASNSRNSINKKLATHVAEMFTTADINVLDLNDFEMPIFSVDKEQTSGHPREAHQFLDHISKSDLVIISLAEHNGSYTTAFKNIFDWASRVNGKVFQDKNVLLLATSPGSRGGIGVLETAKNRFPFHNAKIVGSFSLPEFNKNFTEDEGITNPELKEALNKIIEEVGSKFV